jgi:hypothetical protein
MELLNQLPGSHPLTAPVTLQRGSQDLPSYTTQRGATRIPEFSSKGSTASLLAQRWASRRELARRRVPTPEWLLQEALDSERSACCKGECAAVIGIAEKFKALDQHRVTSIAEGIKVIRVSNC